MYYNLVMKKLALVLAFLFAFVSFVPGSLAQSIKGVKKTAPKTNYNLPYPGILPDHPLYFLKDLKDKLRLFLTFNPEKKAKLLLELSDKKISMALGLSNKGKLRLALKTSLKAEKEFEKLVLFSLKNAELKNNPSFTSKIKLAHDKHREVILEIAAKAQLPDDSPLLKGVLGQLQKNSQLLKKL